MSATLSIVFSVLLLRLTGAVGAALADDITK